MALDGAAAALVTALSAAGLFKDGPSEDSATDEASVAAENPESDLVEEGPSTDASVAQSSPTNETELPIAAANKTGIEPNPSPTDTSDDENDTGAQSPPPLVDPIVQVSEDFPHRAILKNGFKAVGVFEEADETSGKVGAVYVNDIFVVGEATDGWRPIEFNDQGQGPTRGWILDQSVSLMVAND